MIIDSHQHVFWHGRDDAGLIADMDEHGVDRAWLLSWEIAPEDDNPHYHGVLDPRGLRADGTLAGIPLRDLLSARDRYPDRFMAGYCPNPALPHAAQHFEQAYHMHGVRICGEWKFRLCFDDPRCIELFRCAGRLACPVVLHLDVPFLPYAPGTEQHYQPGWYGGTVDQLERALQACPETIFIGHAPGFWREISGDAATTECAYPDGAIVPGGRLDALFERYPTLHADLSANSALKALRRDPEHARAFLSRHADRLLFGRDQYGGDLLAFLAELDLPEAVRDAIMHGNAERLVPTT